jgi:hypothetical protein
MARRGATLTAFVVAGVAVAAGLALLVAPRASRAPDGLQRVAIEEGFADTEVDHPLGDGPAAGYAVDGVDDEGLGTGLAGVLGVAVTFVLAGGLLLVARRSRRRPARGAADAGTPDAGSPDAGTRDVGAGPPGGEATRPDSGAAQTGGEATRPDGGAAQVGAE